MTQTKDTCSDINTHNDTKHKHINDEKDSNKMT